MPRFIKVWLFSALISFTAIIMWKGIGWYYSRGVDEVEPIAITAIDLADAYYTDANVANNLYNDNYVLVTGVITNIGDAGNFYTVNLGSDTYIEIDLTIDIPTEIVKLTTISIGDIITVNGKVTGFYAVYISISDCTIE